MKRTPPPVYRVEHTWPYRRRNRFSYVREHTNLTLAQARAQVAKDKQFEGEGLRQRIVDMRTGKTVLYSRSRRFSAARLQIIANLRGY